MPTCGSPRLIAACHVLHRLLLPRHPPCALSSLTTKFTRCTRSFGYWLLAFSFRREYAVSISWALSCSSHARDFLCSSVFSVFCIWHLAVGTWPRQPNANCQVLIAEPRRARRNTANRHVHQQDYYQALIKIYVRLVICPIYSVVKYRPRWLSPADLHLAGLNCSLPVFVFSLKTKPKFTCWSSSNPMFGAKRLS
jgi:hypothetical protein